MQDIYNNKTYLINNPTWHEADAPFKTEKILQLLKQNQIAFKTIFHIPLDMCVWSLFREKMLIESKERVGHIHNFTEDFITSILTDHGFKIIDKIYTEPTFETMSLKQKFINGIRKILFRINK